MVEVGKKYGMIFVIGDKEIKNRKSYYKIKCDCGKTKYMRADYIEKAKSCGCMRKNKYGLSSKEYAKLYDVWKNMKNRCFDKKSDRYYAYGKRGITVCDEWLTFHKFATWALEHGWNSSLSIERKNHDGNYTPENCEFIPMSEQAKNKTNNLYITKNGKTLCATEWGKILGINPKTIMKRVHDGKTNVDEILFQGDLRSKKEVFG